MARDMASMLVPRLEQAAQSSDVGWHTGVIQSWDELTGLNTVEIAGTVFNNVLVLSTGAPQAYVAGDVVIILRMRTQYFIMGKVREPGYGAGERVASAILDGQVDTESGTYEDLGGPEVTAYIGSSRRALVLVSVSGGAGGLPSDGDGAVCNVRVTGASSIDPGDSGETVGPMAAWLTMNPGGNTGAIAGSMTSTILLTAAEGLEQGQNTFRLVYRSLRGLSKSVFRNRKITVMPY